MKAAGIVWVTVGTIVWCSAVLAELPSMDFEGAKWIWYTSGSSGGLNAIPAGADYFRAAVTLPERADVKSAELIITCDNLFVLYLNGAVVGESEANNSAWSHPRRFNVSSLLVPGQNTVAVLGVNTLPGPAGLIAKLVIRLADSQQIVLTTDATWRCSETVEAGWQQPNFDASAWQPAVVVGEYGAKPWGKVSVRSTSQPAGGPVGQVQQMLDQVYQQAVRQKRLTPIVEKNPPADFAWPEAIVFLGDDCSLYRPLQKTNTAYDSLTVTIFNPRKSRTFPEHDLPAPMKVGHKLYVLKPARPGVKPRLLLDAGKGGIGSPSVSFDGKSLFISMAYDGEPFFHIYQLPADGGKPRRLTDGPFHDIDPAELPDGRIVFTSTRVGTFEEYHSSPSRALFVMNSDGSDIRPLTRTIIFDNEPEVLADGRIVFIRSDNFFDRGKVETSLHAIHPDGTEGYTEFGLQNGPEYGSRLRAYLCGSPAPMPDGRLAFLSGPGIAVGWPGQPRYEVQQFRIEAGDVAAIPDGRLLCTLARRSPVELTVGKKKQTVQDFSYETIAVLDPESKPPKLTILYESPHAPVHSVVYLGARLRPPVIPDKIDPKTADDVQATGYLLCQNARFTKNTTAGWSHVRAIRVLAAKGLTTRSSHSYIVHAGNETIELGTVLLAPDGSFFIEVPADTPIALQAVDAEGRSELNEMSWIYVRPGERRGCVGCHQTRQVAPMSADQEPLALQTAPLKLLGQGEPHRFRGNNAAVTGLMELQFDRYREVAGINRHRITADPLATSAQEVAALVAQLHGRDEELKISAAQRLSIFRDPAAAPALAVCLGGHNRERRVAAAIALAACGTRESVRPLLAKLSDRDPLVAQAAAIALENLTGHADSFNPFAPHADRSRQVRAWRQWFADTTWERIEDELVQRLRSSDRDMVRRAAVALGHSGSRAAQAALREYVLRERDNNPFPAWRKDGKHRGDSARFNSISPVNPRTLQAVTRSIGYLKDTDSVSMLAETIGQNSDPKTANLFLAEAAVEALGRIGTFEAQAALIKAFANLKDYPEYTLWYGDHPALMACHASPVHYFIAEALDSLGSTQAKDILPHLIRSLPIDPDRALLLPNDDYETLIGRIIRRHGAEATVVATCLAILGDPLAKRSEAFEKAISTVHRCWGGHPTPEIRAAQVLSLVCRDSEYESRIRAAFDRYRAKPTNIPRVFDTGIPVVLTLPTKHWVCFYLARALGNLADPRSAEALIGVLEQSPAEAATGRPDPLGPGVHFLHNDLTPCWRAAVCWALGQIGDRRAAPALLRIVGNLANAPDTRHAAAEALGRIADPASREQIQHLAATYPELSTRRALQQACLRYQQPLHTLPLTQRD